jgi:protein-tyrosine phosphatase
MSLQKIKVLFVCTGNICRSPTAEAVFRRHVQAAGLDDRFEIGSAGTHGYHVGDPPDPRSVAVARLNGVDMAAQRARKFDIADFNRYNYIFAMDDGHYAFMSRIKPAEAEDSHMTLFLDFGSKEVGATISRNVPDPYYSADSAFHQVYALIDGQCASILAKLRTKHGL